MGTLWSTHVITFNPLRACVTLIETSQLICTANQLTGFYMRAALALNGLNKLIVFSPPFVNEKGDQDFKQDMLMRGNIF